MASGNGAKGHWNPVEQGAAVLGPVWIALLELCPNTYGVWRLSRGAVREAVENLSWNAADPPKTFIESELQRLQEADHIKVYETGMIWLKDRWSYNAGRNAAQVARKAYNELLLSPEVLRDFVRHGDYGKIKADSALFKPRGKGRATSVEKDGSNAVSGVEQKDGSKSLLGQSKKTGTIEIREERREKEEVDSSLHSESTLSPDAQSAPAGGSWELLEPPPAKAKRPTIAERKAAITGEIDEILDRVSFADEWGRFELHLPKPKGKHVPTDQRRLAELKDFIARCDTHGISLNAAKYGLEEAAGRGNGVGYAITCAQNFDRRRA